MEPIDRRKISSPINGRQGGVKTDAGKEISAQNAIKHGILAKYNTPLDDISFESAYDMFADEFGDYTATRKVLISQLAILLIRIRRCSRFESELIKEKLNPPKYERRLVKKGTDFDISPIFTPDEYQDILTDPGDPMTLSPQFLSELDNVYMKYEAQFLSRFLHIIDFLIRSVR